MICVEFSLIQNQIDMDNSLTDEDSMDNNNNTSGVACLKRIVAARFAHFLGQRVTPLSSLLAKVARFVIFRACAIFRAAPTIAHTSSLYVYTSAAIGTDDEHLIL